MNTAGRIASSPYRARRCDGFIRSLAAAVAALAIAGCVVPVPGDDPLDVEFMSREELREYCEHVFRRHNRTVTRLMAALSAERLTQREHARLERLERRMNRSCRSLNRIASMRARGEDPDLELENRVRRNVRECEQRTARVRQLLDELGIEDPMPSASPMLDGDQG